jgi:NADP-dependent 3-hydroxy acid dehydrogenase YdfG
VIINNAGVAQGKLLLDLKPEDIKQLAALQSHYTLNLTVTYRRTFDVNTLAHFWTLKAFLPEMIREKTGHIVRSCSLTTFWVVLMVASRSPCHQSWVWLEQRK